MRLVPALAGPSGSACASSLVALFVGAWASGGSSAAAPSQASSPAPAAAPVPADRWQLSWSDDFDGDGPPDGRKWVYDLGGHGWGNNELQTYTDRPENAVRRGGLLVITARKENIRGSDGTERSYTSARLKTQGTFSQAYGRFETRMRIPRGQGIWPAFWLLGDNIDRVDWPASGEIDIMENIGKEPNTVHGTMHGPGYSGGQSIGSGFVGPVFADDFHVFAVEWEPNVIRWYVDGALYETRTPADLPRGARWVFDPPMFILVNLAVGGNWPGNPDTSTSFPQELLIDYVRVYSRKQ